MDKARRYREYGGMMPYLIEEYDGVNDFIYEHLYQKKLTAQEVQDAFKERFGDTVLDDEIPSLNTIRKYKREILEDEGSREMMKRAESRNMMERSRLKNEVLDEFHVIEHYKKLYDHALEGVEKSLEFADSANIPTKIMFDALDEASKHLEKLDKALSRYGLTPPMVENKTADLYIQQWKKEINHADLDSTRQIPDEDMTEIQTALENIGLNPDPAHHNANQSEPDSESAERIAQASVKE